MKIGSIVFGSLLLLCAGIAFAGDVAIVTNLGFSDDGRHFAFAQHGVDAGHSEPYADIFIVDLSANNFVSGGRFSHTAPTPVSPGQDGTGALFTTYADSVESMRRYTIDHTSSGRLIYLLIDGADAKSHIDFRDFATGDRYSISLRQQRREAAAAFHIDAQIDFGAGGSRSYRVGLPNHYRDDVLSYRINQVILSPDERSLVFIVEKKMERASGGCIRYMIETVKIR